MRSEQEVLGQLLDFARQDSRIRSVIMNGSRVNPNAPKDNFRDYDIVFAVTDYTVFLNDRRWIGQFGELVILQQNFCDKAGVDWIIFLMQFDDGVRIDLTFFPVEHIEMQYEDSLKVLLLDKDHIVPEFGPPDDSFYHTKKPTEKEFDAAINDFWWCSVNVAKGLQRDELCYAKYMYEEVVRENILHLLSWYVGMKHEWKVNPGKAGKWLKKYLRPEQWNSLVKTYSGADYEDIWESLFEAGGLIREIGTELAETLGYRYPVEDDRRVTGFLKQLRQTPLQIL